MSDDLKKVSQYRLYEGWSADLLEVELHTLSAIDYSFWLESVASLLRSATPSEVRYARPGKDYIFLDDVSNQHRLTARLFRYLSSEQLFGLILSAQNFMPYVRFSKKVSGNELNASYQRISNREVPQGYGLFNGRNLSFEEWIALKLGDWDMIGLCPSLYNYLVNEALFVGERKFINALKHGRAQSKPVGEELGASFMLNGEWVEFFPTEKVIFVEDWKEYAKEDAFVFEHTLSAESFDLKEDVGALYVAYLLMTAIIKTRIAYIEMKLGIKPECKVNYDIPNDIISSKRVTRYMNLPAHRQQRSQ